MAYLNMGVMEAEDQYNSALLSYKRGGCETRASSDCEQDFKLVLLYAERNELHNAGVMGTLDQVKRDLAAGKTTISGRPQAQIVGLLGVAKTKALVATGRHKPSEAVAAQRGVPVSTVKAEQRTAALARKIERLELANTVRRETESRELVSEMDTRMRELARGKARARTQAVITPLALLAAGAIVLSGLYRVLR